MPEVGDQIQLVATKVGQVARTGVVTEVRGRVITVRWPSGDQSLLVPGPGTLTVVGREGAPPSRPKVRGRPSRSAKAAKAAPASMTPKRTGRKPGRKRSSAEKVPARKAVATKAVAKATTKVTAKKAAQKARKAAKRPVPPKRATVPTKAASKRGR